MGNKSEEEPNSFDERLLIPQDFIITMKLLFNSINMFVYMLAIFCGVDSCSV